jgi:hypothetical protein
MGLDVDVHCGEAMPRGLQHEDSVGLITGPPEPRRISLALELNGEVIFHRGHARGRPGGPLRLLPLRQDDLWRGGGRHNSYSTALLL